MSPVDLHIHTTASDGTESPAEVVAHAAALGLRAIAITDHDTIRGHAEALAAGRERGIEVVPGIEVSALHTGQVHILGYYLTRLTPLLAGAVESRHARNEKIAALMAADGLPVDYAAMKKRFGDAIGRPHFGEILMELGLADSVADAFRRYLGRGQRYYVPRAAIPLSDAVEAIADSGGVPVLAHPFQYGLEDGALRALIGLAMDHGLKGMECRYTGYGAEKTQYLERLAEEYGLLKTGGSDYHGAVKPRNALGSGLDGELNVPTEWLDRLREAAKRK